MSQLDAEMRRRVIDAQVARLATVRPDGHPHVVPITFALHADTIVTAIDHKPKTTDKLQRLRNIEAHPVVSIVIDQYDDDWSHLWWVRADGTAHIVGQGPAREQAISWLAGKYAPYRRHPPHGPLSSLRSISGGHGRPREDASRPSTTSEPLRPFPPEPR